MPKIISPISYKFNIYLAERYYCLIVSERLYKLITFMSAFEDAPSNP